MVFISFSISFGVTASPWYGGSREDMDDTSSFKISVFLGTSVFFSAVADLLMLDELGDGKFCSQPPRSSHLSKNVPYE